MVYVNRVVVSENILIKCLDGVSYMYEGDIVFDDYIRQLEDDQVLLNYIASSIGARDGYTYSIKTLADPTMRHSISFSCVCCQDERVQHQLPDDDRARLHARMDVYPCGGTIRGYIDRIHEYIYLKINHTNAHPPIEPMENVRVEMPENVRNYIVENAMDFTATSLYPRIVNRFRAESRIVTQPQVSKKRPKRV